MKCLNCNYDLEQQILYFEDQDGNDVTEYPEPDKYDVCEHCGVIGQYNDSLDLEPLDSIKFNAIDILDPELFEQLMEKSYTIHQFRFFQTNVNPFGVDKDLRDKIRKMRKDKNDN